MMPGHEDREDETDGWGYELIVAAAMMPGHEDREDHRTHSYVTLAVAAAMMPGHEDREDGQHPRRNGLRVDAAMMPGHEDREDAPPDERCHHPWERRNDARSRRPGRHVAALSQRAQEESPQ